MNAPNYYPPPPGVPPTPEPQKSVTYWKACAFAGIAFAVGLIFGAPIGNTADRTAAASETSRQTTAAAPRTTDPLARFTSDQRAFIQAYKAAGYTNSGGDAGIVQLGASICEQIRDGTRPPQTQAEMTSGSLTAEQASALYEMAHRNMCAELSLPDPNSFSTGVYVVGVDIQPGTYRSPGGDNCYWARLGQDQTDILDNYLGSGPSVFTVKSSDGYVELNRCTWTLAD